MSFLPHFQRESASLCWRVSQQGLCPAGNQRNEFPDFTQPHRIAPPPQPSHPSLPEPRISHAEMRECTVLTQITNTQDHQCSHLWAASFGAISGVVALFTETFSSASGDALSSTAVPCRAVLVFILKALSRIQVWRSALDGTYVCTPSLSVFRMDAFK